MFKFRSIKFLIIVLISVLFISLFRSCSEGFTKSSSVLNMQLSSFNKFLSDSKTKPLPIGSPPGSRELIDKNIIYIDAFAQNLTSLVAELSTTMDTTVVPSAKIDELMNKYKPPTGTNINTITPDIGLSMIIVFDLVGIKQLTSEVPKSIFDKYINYRIDMMNGMFSNTDEFLNLVSATPSVIIDRVQMKSKINQYLDDFKQLKNSPPPPPPAPPDTPVANTSSTHNEIPILEQNQSSYRNVFSWMRLF